MLPAGEQSIVWKTLEIQGKGPQPRYQHTMDLIESQGYIVIYGGINDTGKDMIYLSDLWILNLRDLIWIEVFVNTTHEDQIQRAGHCSFALDSQLFVFGGLNQQGYLNSDLLVFEFDQKKVKELEVRPGNLKMEFHEHIVRS